MKLKLPRVNKYAAMLVGAFALAIVAVLLLHSYLKQQKSQYQQQLAAQLSAGMVQVVVPTRNLVPGTVASGQNMAERLYPQDLIYSSTITAAKWPDYAGRTLARAVQAGKPLLENDFIAKANNDFASTLPKTMRAVTIDVDTLNSINGLVRPDDRVDVLLTGAFGPKAGGAGGQRQNEVLPLLRLAKVLATGHRFLGEHLVEQQQDEGVQQANPAMPMQYSTVTLEVTPQQASELILAQQVGSLRVVLSNLRQAPAAGEQVPRMDQAQLLAKLTGNGKGSYAYAPGVQYIIGGSNGGTSQTYAPGPRYPAAPAAAPVAPTSSPAQQNALHELQQMIHAQSASNQPAPQAPGMH
ncbi:Flp pilus assembly protein CpaB [Metallibacterium scheffleri]|jgi:Flp pilus assembly protein CpaB|uniref:Flp pilus assembly protein CpaB n=1 Tax=Metallibacterium scheffleri TaxID=993689 RepID=UPI0026F2191B|nr:Flp pilus assembly protein CpaB [Metallibacterium scheffleri]MBW8075194.1 Flp pilus assembly protein CpaB [Metallibacterium scheffleri]